MFLKASRRYKGGIMQKIIISLFGFIIAILLGIAVMIFGWGLKPESWWWIIGGGCGLRLIVLILEQIGKNESN